jgi:hypothetical protein
MISYNRGEWSEIYSFFDIAEKGYITDNFDKNKRIIVKSVIYEDIGIEFLLSSKKVDVKVLNKIIKTFPNNQFKSKKLLLFDKIKNNSNSEGAFSIDEISSFLEEMSILSSLKGKSFSKGDIVLLLESSNNTLQKKSYSIKSSLGSSATLLNSSKHTDFGYFLKGIDDKQVTEVLSISSRNKLLDRLSYLKSKNALISFDKIISKIFLSNLISINSNLPLILGNALIESYEANSKDLLLNILTSNKSFSKEHLSTVTADFLKASSFGMFPSKLWNKNYSVNGGFIILSSLGELTKIDIDSKNMDDYLLSNVKFDSPSTKRYKMLEPIKNSEKTFYFTLNLQVRFSK